MAIKGASERETEGWVGARSLNVDARGGAGWYQYQLDHLHPR